MKQTEKTEKTVDEREMMKLAALISKKVYAQFKAECALINQSLGERIGKAIEFDLARMIKNREKRK